MIKKNNSNSKIVGMWKTPSGVFQGIVNKPKVYSSTCGKPERFSTSAAIPAFPQSLALYFQFINYTFLIFSIIIFPATPD